MLGGGDEEDRTPDLRIANKIFTSQVIDLNKINTKPVNYLLSDQSPANRILKPISSRLLNCSMLALHGGQHGADKKRHFFSLLTVQGL